MLGLIYVRDLFNLSMKDLADKLDVSKQVISQWENKKIPIAKKRIKQLSDLFHMPEEYFQKELTEVDKLTIQKIKLENELEEFEYEDKIIDDETGKEITITNTYLDEGAMIDISHINYSIEEKKLFNMIKQSLDQCFVGGQDNEDAMKEGLGKASELLDFYREFFNLVNNPNVNRAILKNIMKAVRICYVKGLITDNFTKTVVDTIKKYDNDTKMK